MGPEAVSHCDKIVTIFIALFYWQSLFGILILAMVLPYAEIPAEVLAERLLMIDVLGARTGLGTCISVSSRSSFFIIIRFIILRFSLWQVNKCRVLCRSKKNRWPHPWKGFRSTVHRTLWRRHFAFYGAQRKYAQIWQQRGVICWRDASKKGVLNHSRGLVCHLHCPWT